MAAAGEKRTSLDASAAVDADGKATGKATEPASKKSKAENPKVDVIAQFSTLSFTELNIALAQLKEKILNHPTHPSYATSRPPTKQEIAQASKENLLDNPDLFQLGSPFNVDFKGYRHTGRDSSAYFVGEVKFSLFGLPGSLKLQYESRICKTGDEGFDLIKILLRIESPDCATTLVDFHTDDYWPNQSGMRSRMATWNMMNAMSGGIYSNMLSHQSLPEATLKWAGFNKPVLNHALKGMGFSAEQAAAAVKSLFQKLEYVFENSGLYEDPCALYIRFLLDLEAKWGEA